MTQLTQESSQTASDYIDTQLRLEADARETLPYQFDSCTKPLGPLRQLLFACLTCTPAPASSLQKFTPAGICYSCSISCHGDHELVELFCKRDFVCDCGSTRYRNSQAPCSLRLNTETSRKGGVVNEEARQDNKYNHNFAGKFCGCGETYDPELEKGTMFQCLGLGTVETGGCGEDWWHAECIMGLPRNKGAVSNGIGTVDGPVTEESATEGDAVHGTTEHAEHAAPSGFPAEESFDHFICYKCTEAFPWIKQYAGSSGFLPAVPHGRDTIVADGLKAETESTSDTRKRKAEHDDSEEGADTKKIKSEQGEVGHNEQDTLAPATAIQGATALHESLPTAATGKVSLFLKEDFRNHLCRCPECFPRLARHLQLLEEEEPYEPPLSESDEDEQQSIAGRSVNSGSLLERGEAALSSMDRVRAIEGVMAYNHVRDKVKEFLAPYAQSGEAVGAEAIRAYFAQLRGDEEQVQ